MKLAPRLLAAVALAACGFAATAQQPAPMPPPPAGMQGPHDMGAMGQMHERMREHMQQERQARMQRRMESLKRILQITPQQEGAWANWSAAMRPAPHARPNPGEFERMTTPERIDRMRQMRAQRQAEMDRRAEATKAFYAQLTPPQQRAFDEISLKMLGHHGRRGHGEHGEHGGF